MTQAILICPGLCGPLPLAPEPFPVVPALDALLRQARSAPWSEPDPLGSVLSLCGIAATAEGDWPSAPLCWLGDTPGALPETRGWWLHADPVHLHADLDRLRLFGAEQLDPGAEEAETLVHLLNAHFASEGLRWSAPHPQRWYLHLDHAPQLSAPPLHAVLGEPLSRDQLRGPESMSWARRQTEAQMLLHASTVNAQRPPQATINGVWFWGAGSMPDAASESVPAVLIGDHPLLRGLARWAGCTHQTVSSAEPPASDHAWLLYDDAPAQALRAHDLHAWSEALRGLDSLLAAHQPVSGELCLIDPLAQRQWRVNTRYDRWRRWWSSWSRRGGLRTWLRLGHAADA